ncbi:MAG: hypothetical protein NT126_07525 [Bacteroidetes bacterium]|nr:hypothetical protein [Bacteroidota bacterium]
MDTHHLHINRSNKGEKLAATLVCIFILLSECVVADSPTDFENSGKKFLPTVSMAEGVMSFIGDVGNNRFNQPLMARSGFQIEIQKPATGNLAFSIFLLSGKVFGDEKTLLRNLNFESGIVSEGVMFRYDFINHKNSQQLLTPFISAGIEYISFHPKSDMKDANGNYYHYWKDGSIRSLDQNDTNASQAVIVHRDYVYETELRDANIDGLGKFEESALGFPVGAGVRLRLSGRCSMHFSSVCHFTNTDFIDAVTEKSIGYRQGNSSNDKFIYSSVSFRYDFSSPRETPGRSHPSKFKPLIDVSHVDFDALVKADADHDGVTDFNDDVALNPEHVNVDAHGRPLDSDDDGIPDYRDDEPASAKNALVDEHGVTITDSLIAEKFKRDSLSFLPAIIEYLKCIDKLSMMDSTFRTRENSSSSKREVIPPTFSKLDTDNNGVISPSEISSAIDDYLNGKSPYNTDEFFQLIDFFFKQH